MSRFGVFDLARDATLAVGAYVGILREHVKGEWATVLGGSFDERVEEARARMEAHADALNEHEAENDGLEGDCGLDETASGEYLERVGATISDEYRPVYEARLQASVAACQRTEEARSGETPRPAPGLSNDVEVVKQFIAAEEKRAEIAVALQDALGDNYDWAPSSLPPCAILPFFHDMNGDDGSVTPGIHHGFDWDGIVYDLLREFDIRKK